MNGELNSLPPEWTELQHRLEDQLVIIQKEENSDLKMASRSMQLAMNMLHEMQSLIVTHHFLQGEEICFYKTIKPFFISRVLLYSWLFRIETNRPAAGPAGLQSYYTNELKQLTALYNEHMFIHRYMQTASTYLDEKLFFRPGPNSTVAISGVEPPADGAFPICYDHVVGQLLAADLLKRHLLESIEDLANPGRHGGNLPRITWTAPKAHGIELGYALYAAGVCNNGKAQLKDIMECLGAAFHIDWGNYARTWQEILYRKGGRTVFQDNMKNEYLLYIQRIEDKHIG
jgi:RteC protein